MQHHHNQHQKKSVITKILDALETGTIWVLRTLYINSRKLFNFLKKSFWLVLCIFFVILGSFFIWVATLPIPSISDFHNRKVVSSTQILDRTGKINLYDIHENIQRQIVTGEEISYHAKHAIISIEDEQFYEHHGVRVVSTVRAVLANVLPFYGGSNKQGGSTLTQQVIKNTILSKERSITRKVKEWVLAVKLENSYSKDEILTLYLNEAPYGGTLYGISEGSRVFFNKKPIDLTITESAYLASLPNAPTYYSPYTEKGRARLEYRKKLVLKKMYEQGYITETEYTSSRDEYIKFLPQKDSGAKAMHFVDYIKSYIEKKYGPEALISEGFQVITTLDWDLQQVAEKTISENAFKNETAWDATNSALVAIDPKTGQILSMVGSRNYFDDKIDGQYNVATAVRQPGSSFKPIVYTRAFEKGYEPETFLFDTPTTFAGTCTKNDGTPGCYAPDNYDGKFVGPISLRDALAQSRNIPAVKLLYLVGVEDALRTAKNLGITTLDKNADRYGLTLVLGGGETSLLEMTSVYGIFGNDGIRNEPVGILKITDAQGNILEEYTPKPEQVISAEATRKISSVLSDNIARSPLFGTHSFLYFGNTQVAGKTGTTNDNKDAWLIGYTPTIAVGVWSGNNDNKPMKKGSAISGPAWNTFMTAAIAKLGTENFKPSGGIDTTKPPVIRGKWWGGESFWVDKISGGLATEYTPNETREERVIPNVQSILYWIDKENPNKLSNNHTDGQLARWQAGVQQWVQNNRLKIPGEPIRPNFNDTVHTEFSNPKISATLTDNKNTFSIHDNITVSINNISSINPLNKIILSFNGQQLESYPADQKIISFIPENYTILTGSGILTITVVDTLYNRGVSSISLNITE